MYQMGDEDTDQWEQIKNWAGASEPQTDHPVKQMIKREMRKVPHMDQGGQVPDDILSFLEPQGAGLIAPSIGQTTQIPQAPEMAPESPQMPPEMPPQAPPAPMNQPVPMAPPPSSGQQAHQILGTSPEELKAFLQKNNSGGIRENIGMGLNGLADAIMQGVARAGPSHFQDNFIKTNQARRDATNAIPEKAATLGKETYGLEAELDSKDPESPYSKIAQKSYGSDLIAAGIPQSEIHKMPASLIGDVVSKRITLQEALSRIQETAEYHRGMLGVQHESNMTREQEAETQRKNAEREALKNVAGGSPIPFVGPTHKEKRAAIEKLGDIGGIGDGGGQQVGPYGATTTRNGVDYEWSASTGKYHRKQ